MKPATAQPASESSRTANTALSSLLAGDSSRFTWPDGLPGMAFVGGTDHNRTLEWVSDGCVSLLGVESVAPFELGPLIHPEEQEMVWDYLATATADLQPFAVEYRIRHASGRWRTIWEQSRPVRHGHQILLHGYIMDITARGERDRARLAAEHERLQHQKTLALNKLARGIVHEFGNIVQGIQGSADAVAADLPPSLQEAQESLNNILEASKRAGVFAQKIREFAQRPLLERKLMPLAPVIEDCLQILRPIIRDKVEIIEHLAPDCPAVCGDAASLHQVLMDLCLHAWHGLPERRGQLKISLEHHPRGVPAHVRSLRPGPHLCLTVGDNGPGLDKIARDKIFDPFHFRKATGKQLGLEMFLMREIVQAHQGEIIVESEPDQGTAFHIYLPVAGES